MERSGTRTVTAMTKTSTPMPPIQWVKLRQKSRPWLMISTLSRMVAPVVVKPLTVSKNASIKTGISRLMTKGSAPKKETAIHASATMTSPSFENSVRSFGRRVRQISPPTASVMPIVMRNAQAHVSR